MSLLKPKKAVAAKRPRVPILPDIDDSQLKDKGGRLTMKEQDGAYAYLAAAPKKILYDIVQHYNKGQIADGEYVKAPSTLTREELFKAIRYIYTLDYRKEYGARSGSSGYEWGLGSYDPEDEYGLIYETTNDPKGLHKITSKWFYKPPRKKRVSKKKVPKKKVAKKKVPKKKVPKKKWVFKMRF